MLVAVYICTVYRQAGSHFDERVPKLRHGYIPRLPVVRRQRAQTVHQRSHVAREEALHHQLVALVADLGERHGIAGPLVVDFLQPRQAGRLDEYAVQGVEKIVTGGPAHRPLVRQRLIPPQNFLHHNVERLAAAHRVLQPLEEAARVPQPIDMVDAQARHLAAAHQFQRLAVTIGEYFGRFDA